MASRDVSITPSRWTRLFGNRASNNADSTSDSIGHAKWTMGILNDRETVEVPGQFSRR